ncbi:quercetin dioxygenase-like cupin family protein [Natranaerovirga pectinivora]|uniref:Quercetin dioxygenase-like cupin family protein n=1 Tax=Natranaerovirga pectinivora TaxID=682400 RepID=A0A4R3MFG0_9FIRM|nr:cupin domain-containing protein [Natranaerovirga pectinivora]TCT12283.1 quercetin dioxygenase-like cupin family protein [Natranaerovirga pectinivora]
MEIKHFFMSDETEWEDLGSGIKRRIAAYHENLMAVEMTFEENSVGPIHSHPHEQISYILEGEFEFTVGDEKKVVKAGDCTFKEPNIPHGAVCLKKGRLIDVFTPHRQDFLK